MLALILFNLLPIPFILTICLHSYAYVFFYLIHVYYLLNLVSHLPYGASDWVSIEPRQVFSKKKKGLQSRHALSHFGI